MKWRFWKHEPADKTILQISEATLTCSKFFYVEAQSSEKALELMEKLRKAKS